MTQRTEQAVTDRAPAAMIAGAIPLIDVSGHLAGDAEASRKAAAQLRWAFENVGFYYVSDHGVAGRISRWPKIVREGWSACGI